VLVQDCELLGELQDMLTSTCSKDGKTWSSDRGCKKHPGVPCKVGKAGRRICGEGCDLRETHNDVPVNFKLIKAYRNQNMDLWTQYAMTRDKLLQAVGDVSEFNRGLNFQRTWKSKLGRNLLNSHCCEWRVWHGTKFESCKSICQKNYNIALAGGKEGTSWTSGPLYGPGAYLAESITQADEHVREIAKRDYPDGVASSKKIYSCVLFRALGGKAKKIVEPTTDEKLKLKDDIHLKGTYQSVIGARRSQINGAFDEFVFYRENQLFPEYLILYERVFA
jgi:hypothetical protein